MVLCCQSYVTLHADYSTGGDWQQICGKCTITAEKMAYGGALMASGGRATCGRLLPANLSKPEVIAAA
jgi:hypothetical protein